MEFTIATLNTYWLYDNEEPLKRFGGKLPAGGLEMKVKLIAEAICEIGPSNKGPDVVALQEVEGPHVLNLLVQKLRELGSPIKRFWCSQTLDPYTGQNVALLSRFAAITEPVKRLDQYVLEYKDYRERSRMGSLGKFIRVDLEIGGEVMTFFVIHLKSQRFGAEMTRPLRNTQAQIVRNLSRPRIEQGSSKSPSFTAILGDMNDEPKTAPLDILLGKHDTSYGLFSATEGADPEEKYTYTYNGKNQQLDHILLNLFANKRLLASGFTRIDMPTSDHDAVWAKLEF